MLAHKNAFILSLLMLSVFALVNLSACSSDSGSSSSNDDSSNTPESTDNSSNNDSSSTNNDTSSSNNKVVLPSGANVISGRSTYQTSCERCHGSDGKGGIGPSLISCPTCKSFDTMNSRIISTMPPSSASSCVGDCSRDVSSYIMCEFNPDNTDGCP